MRILSSHVSSTLLAFIASLSSCKSKEDAELQPAATATATQVKRDQIESDATPRQAPEPKDDASDGRGSQVSATVVSAPGDIEPAYPVALDPLLALVPDDATSFIVVRDPHSLAHGTSAYVRAAKASLLRLSDELAKTDPVDGEVVRHLVSLTESLDRKVEASGVDLAAGLVFVERKGNEELIIYGADNPRALPVLLESVHAAPDVIPTHCAKIPKAPGYVVCSNRDTDTYVPSQRASTLRDRLGRSLAGVDLDRANVVTSFQTHDADLALAVETGQSMAHVVIGVPSARARLQALAAPGTPSMLDVVKPGQPFVWGRLQRTALVRLMEPPPELMPFAQTLTGEFVVGGVAKMKGIAALVGVTDPAPAAALVTLASFAFDEFPKHLPGGIEVEYGRESIQIPRGSVATVRARWSGGSTSTLTQHGYAAEALAFAGGKIAALTFGLSTEVVTTLVSDSPEKASPELLETLPPALARALRDERTFFAIHAPLDALQASAGKAVLQTFFELVPPEDLAFGEPKSAARASVDALAPLSGLSVWMTDLDQGPTLHVLVQGFGAVGTEEGAAAFDAMKAVSEGADRASTYGGLAAKYPTSARRAAYESRAGHHGDPMASVGAGTMALLAFGLWLAVDEEAVPVSPKAD